MKKTILSLILAASVSGICFAYSAVGTGPNPPTANGGSSTNSIVNDSND